MPKNARNSDVGEERDSALNRWVQGRLSCTEFRFGVLEEIVVVPRVQATPTSESRQNTTFQLGLREERWLRGVKHSGLCVFCTDNAREQAGGCGAQKGNGEHMASPVLLFVKMAAIVPSLHDRKHICTIGTIRARSRERERAVITSTMPSTHEL